jgi:hypothetical protein
MGIISERDCTPGASRSRDTIISRVKNRRTGLQSFEGITVVSAPEFRQD